MKRELILAMIVALSMLIGCSKSTEGDIKEESAQEFTARKELEALEAQKEDVLSELSELYIAVDDLKEKKAELEVDIKILTDQVQLETDSKFLQHGIFKAGMNRKDVLVQVGAANIMVQGTDSVKLQMTSRMDACQQAQGDFIFTKDTQNLTGVSISEYTVLNSQNEESAKLRLPEVYNSLVERATEDYGTPDDISTSGLQIYASWERYENTYVITLGSIPEVPDSYGITQSYTYSRVR